MSQILAYSPEFLWQMVDLFVDEYSKLENHWDRQLAQEFLERDLKLYAELCWIAVDKQKLLGYILCRSEPLCRSYYLGVSSIQVIKSQQGEGIARDLFNKALETAKSKKLTGVVLSIDSRLPHPKDWYLRMGFNPSGWIELIAKIDELC